MDASRASATTVYTPSVHAAAMPLDAYQLSAAQEAQKVNLSILMDRACMRSFGLSYLPHYTDRTKIITATFAVYNSRRYGISDPVAASRFGYHPPSQPTTTGSSDDGDQADTSPTTMSPDKRRVFTGVAAKQLPSFTAKTPDSAVSPGTYLGKTIPAGGCSGQTHRELKDDPAPGAAKANELAARLNQEAFTKTLHDRRALTASAAWRQCMTAKGYSRYATPLAASAGFNLNGPVTKREIKTAVADVACQQQVHYVQTLTTLEAGYQKSSIAQHTAALAPLKAQVAGQLTALRKALQANGG
ncbi:hypothetical protein [Actinoallomurus sp. NPDC052274]|uniref:hypothetical protein n=1 Tax=Actinoallomurus sp. NPDC052274 TaxID=3155420 RepID=UPI003441BD7F